MPVYSLSIQNIGPKNQYIQTAWNAPSASGLDLIGDMDVYVSQRLGDFMATNGPIITYKGSLESVALRLSGGIFFSMQNARSMDI